MKNWPTVRVSDIFNLQMGKTPARDNPTYWGGDKNWASIADIAKSGKYISETKESISDAAVKETGIKAVPANTVIMSFKLSIGRTAITTTPGGRRCRESRRGRGRKHGHMYPCCMPS